MSDPSEDVLSEWPKDGKAIPFRRSLSEELESASESEPSLELVSLGSILESRVPLERGDVDLLLVFVTKLDLESNSSELLPLELVLDTSTKFVLFLRFLILSLLTGSVPLTL